MTDSEDVQGIKVARLVAAPPYSPVSAWEFDDLQKEQVFRDLLKDCSVYVIGQRAMLWFDNVVIGDNDIRFDIADGLATPVPCRLRPVDIGLCRTGETLNVEVGFHHDGRRDTQPYRKVAALRMYDRDGEFKVWWSPQKLLFEAINRGLPVDIGGDVSPFMEYRVHYIGKAFKQTVWNRLKRHTAYPRILAKQRVEGIDHSQPSLEITLFMLKLVDLVETRYFVPPEQAADIPPDLIHVFRQNPADPRYAAFQDRWASPKDAAATTELETLLIHAFKPHYNGVLYEDYPDIADGLRAMGYASTDLTLEQFPYVLLDADGAEPLGDELDED